MNRSGIKWLTANLHSLMAQFADRPFSRILSGDPPTACPGLKLPTLCRLQFGLLLCVAGCNTKLPDGAIVLTQTPVRLASSGNPQDLLDQRYPAGSRVVMVLSPDSSREVRTLSRGLLAAGSPAVCPEGKRLFFVGKTQATEAWQIYEANLAGGRPKAVTAVEGGAKDPAINSTGELVFSSPVPKAGETWKTQAPPALFLRSAEGRIKRLTFGARAAVEPTVLRDGRILFISAHPPGRPDAPPNLGLFTVNNDGTEVTAFALDGDGAPEVHRPRELRDDRIGFLAKAAGALAGETWAEGVRTARPFHSRTSLFAFPTSHCRSVEPVGDGTLLACFEARAMMPNLTNGSSAVYRVAPNSTRLGEPLFDDPSWHDIEAISASPRGKPMGHISAILPKKKTGTILCLNADFTRRRSTNDLPTAKSRRIRVLAAAGHGQVDALGEVPVQADGSFMVEVPADTPVGFEALDEEGRVLRRLPPTIWVRPGENRSCLGCHEPPNHSSRNVRPLAASLPPAVLTEKPRALVQTTP